MEPKLIFELRIGVPSFKYLSWMMKKELDKSIPLICYTHIFNQFANAWFRFAWFSLLQLWRYSVLSGNERRMKWRKKCYFSDWMLDWSPWNIWKIFRWTRKSIYRQLLSYRFPNLAEYLQTCLSQRTLFLIMCLSAWNFYHIHYHIIIFMKQKCSYMHGL